MNMIYEATWESLNRRPVPQWFTNAKFGIFIHWGIYSVPAYSAKGQFAEWYMQQMRDPNHPVHAFHHKTYGPNFRYEDFAACFKAELFDANAWAKLFRDSGARYINIVSKHHDGFCMYPSEYAWNWNSMDIGPHRDFLGELRLALEGTGVRFGVYHSLYEWFHPLYRKDPEAFALQHLIPMLKELILRYEPNTLFTDGEWEQSDTTWHSTEFLAWLYNESPVREFIVPNDRWGIGTRGRCGGNFTTEYGSIGNRDVSMEDILSRRCYEECRGIGGSFGLNRLETPEDYLSARELLRLLVTLVASGGNLLLNIGPAADGTIPPIMQERLLQMGHWLRVNGEAIYDSSPLTYQRGEHLWYTQKPAAIYAITDRFPFGEIFLDHLDWQDGQKATLLGAPQIPLKLSPREGKTLLQIPPFSPEDCDSSWLYTFRIENANK